MIRRHGFNAPDCRFIAVLDTAAIDEANEAMVHLQV